MELIMIESAVIQRKVEINDEMLERLINIFCKEYNVKRSSIPKLTCLELSNILYMKDDTLMVEKNGEICKLYPLFKEFLAKHLRASDIFNFDPQLRIFLEKESVLFTSRQDI